MTILISCCPDDAPRKYGYFYLKRFSQYAAEFGHRVIFLRNALLTNFQKALIKYDPRFVILQGHGGSKGVTGCGEHVILGIKTYDRELNVKIVNQNPEWMTGRIVMLFTCFAGRELAPALMRAGAEAVAAFKSAFIFLTEEYPNGRAEQFLEPIVMLPSMMVEGFSFGEACGALKSTLKENLIRAEVRGDRLSAKYLHHNLVNFVSLGNMNTHL